MSFKVVAFYTVGSPYMEEAKKLEKSLIRLKLDYIVQGVEPRHSWVQNAGIKPEFIYDMMQAYKGRDILYVDCDAIIHSYPKLFDNFKGDIGVHYFKGKELLSGTIFFKNNSKTRSLIRMWIMEQHKNSTTWDQKTLNKILNLHRDELELTIIDIPPTYTQIFDIMKNCGVPVIEHFQASRRFKRLMTDKEKQKMIPKTVDGVATRTCPDGSFWLPRVSRETMKRLDKEYIRVSPGRKAWMPKTEQGLKLIDELKPIFEGKNVYIVGKGPSLDHLNTSHFSNCRPETPIICINESIHKVESLNLQNPIFCMQQDIDLKEDCLPKKATMLIAWHLRQLYKNYTPRFLYHPEQFRKIRGTLTVILAIRLVQYLEASMITFVSFDAVVNDTLGYAKVIKKDPVTGGQLDRFLKHREKIEKHLDNTVFSHITPQSPSDTSDDTPQPLSDNRLEHHGLGHEESLTDSLTSSNLLLSTEPSQHEMPPDRLESEQQP